MPSHAPFDRRVDQFYGIGARESSNGSRSAQNDRGRGKEPRRETLSDSPRRKIIVSPARMCRQPSFYASIRRRPRGPGVLPAKEGS